MEHLPAIPAGKVQGLETVPYVCEKSYDGGPFLTYPIRENRPEIIPDPANVGKKLLWEYEKQHPTPNKEFEAFCQTWLFFGLLNELLGDICKPSDFLQPDQISGSSTISTLKLPGLIKQWAKSVQEGTSSMSYEHVAKCLRLTHSTLMATGPQFDLSVKLCIASVGNLFEYATNAAFGIENLVVNNECPAIWTSLLEENTWIELLLRSGWCPSQIVTLVRSASSIQSLYFSSSMQDSVSAGRHEACDILKCVAYHTNLEDYKTQHVIKECKCQELHVDMSSLEAVLITGALPLLRISEAKTLEEVAVEVVAYEPSSQYLALSHVWADGLGNVKANALPRCQLLQLSKIIRGLGEKLSTDDSQSELLFWCDTLCCPSDPGEGKTQVLGQMKHIYENATCALVLDASLRRYKSATMGPEEMCSRILASGWMRRLWTLQEGALSADKRRLWFQFCDEAVNLRSLWRDIVSIFHSDDFSRRGIARDIISRMGLIRHFFHRETSADLTTLDRAFEHRSVSVSSDEPLLIGTLLGLDVDGILNGSDETRMRRMWSAMPAANRGIPKSILFRLGPRLKEKGYRWAPSSMLYHEETNQVLKVMRKGDNQGTPTEHGLMVRLCGYHIDFPRRPSGLPDDPWFISLDKNLLYMRDGEACWYIAQRRWPNADGDYLSNESFSSAVLRNHTNLWITFLETDTSIRTDIYQQTFTSLLTRLICEKNEVKYVHSHMHIHVFQLRKHVCDMIEAAYRCGQKLAESSPAQRLEYMAEDETNLESAEPQAVFDTLQPEIERIIAEGDNKSALATCRQTYFRDDDRLFGLFVWLMFLGRYAIMGPRTPHNQQWCVD